MVHIVTKAFKAINHDRFEAGNSIAGMKLKTIVVKSVIEFMVMCVTIYFI